MNIKTNRKDNELNFATYHARISFTSLYMQKIVDKDLFVPTAKSNASFAQQFNDIYKLECILRYYKMLCFYVFFFEIVN